MRPRIELVLVVMLTMTASLMFACTQTQPPPTEPQVATTAPNPSTFPTPSAEPSPSAGAVTGSKGQPLTVGSWTVLVREAEFDDKVADDTSAQGTFVKVEIDLTNNGSALAGVGPGDFQLRPASGAPIDPFMAKDPKNTPQRDIAAGKTEDVKAYFQVPAASGTYTLVFTPAEGGPGSAEVTVP